MNTLSDGTYQKDPEVEFEEGDELDDTWHSDECWSSSLVAGTQGSWIAGDDDEEDDDNDIVPTTLSKFTEFAFYLPRTVDTDQGKLMSIERFSFEGRRHMERLYDTQARRIQYFTSRQCEKSTLLSNKALSRMVLVPGYKQLYVSPSASQTKVFSNDRVKESIDTSPVLRKYTTRTLSLSVFDKKFTNRSSLMLRYAFLNADRVRGISTYGVSIDEFQDVLPEVVPIIEMCASHAPQHLKVFEYAGTPKGLENHHEELRATHSTQAEWVVPCDHCGMKGMRHWNVLGEANIGLKGLICSKCGMPLDPMCRDAHWANMVKYDPDRTPWESYRITQLMVPWVDWKKDILHHRDTDERAKFFNEVLGLSYDSGTRPLTKALLRSMCRSDIQLSDVEKYRAKGYTQPIFAGIDWSGGTDASYTVIVLGTYTENFKLRVFFAHRFIGADMEPEPQLEKIIELLRYFNVKIVGVDYGGGLYPNDKLVRVFGKERIKSFQYLAKSNKGKVKRDDEMRPPRWKIARTEIMSDIFNAIRAGKFEFPNWNEWKQVHGRDMTNIVSEYNERLRMIQYTHASSNPDDTFHALTYMTLASMFLVRRPDIFTADRSDAQGLLMSQFADGYLYQG